MQKAFNPITWKNLPSTETALEAANLNRIEQGLNTVDNRVVEFDTSKANQAEFLSVFKEVTFDSTTGQFTFTRENNTTKVIDTDIEKIAIKRGCLKKGGETDFDKAAAIVLDEFRSGKLGRITLEEP